MEAMNLTQKLSAITGEIGAIPKEKKPGSSVAYAYRGIDDVMNKLNPLLAKHNITIQSKVLSSSLQFRTKGSKETCLANVTYQLIFSDGTNSESIEEAAMSEDYGDKAMTQAMSMAYKYCILRKFCILTADVVDPDAYNQPQEPKKEVTDEELVALWEQKLKACKGLDELKKVFGEGSKFISAHPELIKLKDEMKSKLTKQ